MFSPVPTISYTLYPESLKTARRPEDVDQMVFYKLVTDLDYRSAKSLCTPFEREAYDR